MPEPQAVPSTWRIIRAYLTQRESASHKHILAAIRVHRPLMSNPQYHNKMAQFENNGLIGHRSRALIYLTQKGREYVVDPKESMGLPTWVPPAAIKTDAIVEVTKQAAQASTPHYHSKEHMAKMLAARKAKQTAKAPRGPNHKRRTPEELQATRELRAKLREARRAKPEPTITIAGVKTKVDSDLIERLLNQNKDQADRIARQRDTLQSVITQARPDQTIDLPIGIRLKISVEVV